MNEQQVENTQEQAQEPFSEQVQGTVPEGQEPSVQPQVEETDLSKADPTKLTPEQVSELQKGYMRQADYTRKTQELATQRKQPMDYASIVQSEDFANWAKQMGLFGQSAQQQAQTQEPEFLRNLDPDQIKAFEYIAQKMMQPYVQSYTNMTLQQQDEKLKSTYGEVYTPQLQQELTALQRDIIQGKGALYREELFRIKDYDNAVKRAFEAGRQEGLKGKQVRQQANIPQGTPSQQINEQIFAPTDSRQEKFRKAFEAAEKKVGVDYNRIGGGHYIAPNPQR